MAVVERIVIAVDPRWQRPPMTFPGIGGAVISDCGVWSVLVFCLCVVIEDVVMQLTHPGHLSRVVLKQLKCCTIQVERG